MCINRGRWYLPPTSQKLRFKTCLFCTVIKVIAFDLRFVWSILHKSATEGHSHSYIRYVQKCINNIITHYQPHLFFYLYFLFIFLLYGACSNASSLKVLWFLLANYVLHKIVLHFCISDIIFALIGVIYAQCTCFPITIMTVDIHLSNCESRRCPRVKCRRWV